jgi:chromate reductase
MSNTRNVGLIVGSLRKASLNRKLGHALIALAPPSLRCHFVEIGELPLYNQDLETDTPPAAWSAFRAGIAAADAMLFLTPEYNRGVPAPLKNAIDVGSRPSGKSVFRGKPACVVSVSPGSLGGFGANHALRQSLMCLRVPVLPHEAYVSGADKLFDESGALVNEQTRDFMSKMLGEFAAWIERNAAV